MPRLVTALRYTITDNESAICKFYRVARREGKQEPSLKATECWFLAAKDSLEQVSFERRTTNFRNLRRTNDATVSLDDISYCRSTAGYIALITLLVAVCMNFCCTTPSKVGVRYGFVGELASDRNMIAGYDRFYS